MSDVYNEWSKLIDENIPHNFLALYIKLQKIRRFRFHYCEDTVFLHTIRMYELHKKYFELQGENIYQRLAILLHDFEEAFTGDIPTQKKTDKDRINEEWLLNRIKEKVNESNNEILKNNISKLITLNSEDKLHLKVLDTFDGMMFSFHMINQSKKGIFNFRNREFKDISFLAPLFYYLQLTKKKSFINYLAQCDTNIRYTFFRKNNKTGLDVYQEIYAQIHQISFNQKDIEKIVSFEEEILQGKWPNLDGRNMEVFKQIYTQKFEIENFDEKLKNLISIFSEQSHYKEWLIVYNDVNKNYKVKFKALEPEFLKLTQKNITQ